MKKQIAMTFVLVAGAMLTLAGCVSMPEGGTQDDSAMMLNYPWVELSLTDAQASLNYPWANTALDSQADVDSAMVSLNYPWTAFADESDEASNGLEMYPYVFVASRTDR